MNKSSLNIQSGILKECKFNCNEIKKDANDILKILSSNWSGVSATKFHKEFDSSVVFKFRSIEKSFNDVIDSLIDINKALIKCNDQAKLAAERVYINLQTEVRYRNDL